MLVKSQRETCIASVTFWVPIIDLLVDTSSTRKWWYVTNIDSRFLVLVTWGTRMERRSETRGDSVKDHKAPSV